ncbi:hypothetical protein EUGRSUZ_D00244 [Eucalyptus grandis]|uniref:Uncharacterized protein n=2 Tax=Eucalyptus grandis TaxID=71139 RepID=A0ACC3L321_EUCGR|nr:hypothetical protein EUGRSUZ_D00244 [Eucalyptus grandis]
MRRDLTPQNENEQLAQICSSNMICSSHTALSTSSRLHIIMLKLQLSHFFFPSRLYLKHFQGLLQAKSSYMTQFLL